MTRLNTGMIICYIGGMGSGKTLSMVREAYGYHLAGFTVYSNFGLCFPHRKITKQIFESMLDNSFELRNAILCLDEVYVWMDSRMSSSSSNRLLSWFFNQTRKRSVRVLMTSQTFDQLDRRLRHRTDLVIRCKSRHDGQHLLCTNFVGRVAFDDEFHLVRIVRFVGNPYFALYDTEEVVTL